MKDLFIHLHIPKTGGTTLRDIIHRQYRSKQILEIPKLEKSESIIKEISGSKINQLIMIQGHLKYGIHKIFHRNTKYFVIIRNPIHRVLSTYYYVLNQTNNPQNLSTSNNQMTIYDFVQSGVNPFLINGQTQLIAGKTSKSNDPLIRSEELFLKAKYNIDNHFIFIGITELFDESILLLKNLLNWTTPYYSRANRTKKKPNYNEISPEIRSFIEEHNQLDQKLYEAARESLNRKITASGSEFQNKVSRFKKTNNIINPLFGYSRAKRYISKLFR